MSYIAGYIFYLASTLKINHDRIQNAKPITTKIVKEIVTTTDIFFNMVCGEKLSSQDDLDKKFSDLKFDTVLSGYANIQVLPNHQIRKSPMTITDAMNSNLVSKINSTHINSAYFYPILVPDVQVKLFEYMNCNFFQIFNESNRSVMQLANAELAGFTSVFISLLEAKENLVREYEKYYGELA
ncbi:hypothetical protein IS636_003600 [Vibrio cholerae]